MQRASVLFAFNKGCMLVRLNPVSAVVTFVDAIQATSFMEDVSPKP